MYKPTIEEIEALGFYQDDGDMYVLIVYEERNHGIIFPQLACYFAEKNIFLCGGAYFQPDDHDHLVSILKGYQNYGNILK